MRFTWTLTAISVVVGGAALVFLLGKFRRQVLSFLPDSEDEKNFGAFPPEIPHYEFDGIDFV
mgnify:CR=1 FL=1